MEPKVTERDLALLMLNEDSWVALGAVLGLQALIPPSDERCPEGLPLVEARPA